MFCEKIIQISVVALTDPMKRGLKEGVGASARQLGCREVALTHPMICTTSYPSI